MKVVRLVYPLALGAVLAYASGDTGAGKWIARNSRRRF